LFSLRVPCLFSLFSLFDWWCVYAWMWLAHVRAVHGVDDDDDDNDDDDDEPTL
jgi:hypothetical protein